MRVALFITCLADTLFPEVGQATVEVLERLGHQVAFPEAQTCCGQMHINTGYRADAVRLIENFVRAFGDADVIVTPSASCAAAVRDMHGPVAAEAGHARLAADAAAVAARVFELSELLVDQLETVDVGASFPHRVTYHPTCHSLRLLQVGDRPLRLLGAVRGIDLIPLTGAEECCGFGGTFAVKNPDVSVAMLSDKMARILQTGAQYVCSADASCLMHIGGGLSRLRAGAEPIHLAQVLAAQG